MKKKTSAVTAVLLTVTICTGIFAAAGIFLLPAALYSAPAPVGETVSGVSYGAGTENCGLLFLLDGGSGALLFLDFDENAVKVSLFEDDAAEQAAQVGYEINYTVKADMEFIGRLTDRLGGIVLNKNGADLRFSSAGIKSELEENPTEENAEKIAAAFFEKIAKTGLSSGDFKFIMENTRTDLNYPVCYEWIDYIPAMFGNYVFLN